MVFVVNLHHPPHMKDQILHKQYIDIALRDACLVACQLMLSCFGRPGFITALSEHLNQLSPGPPLCGGVVHYEFPDKEVRAYGPEIAWRVWDL